MRMNRWFILTIIFLARMSMAYQFQSIASVAPFLAKDFGIEYAGIGSLIGFYMLSGAVLAFTGGKIGEGFGDKRAVLFGLIIIFRMDSLFQNHKMISLKRGTLPNQTITMRTVILSTATFY